MPSSTPKEIQIILIIWGDKFWNTFLNYTLFTRLSDKNLLSLSQNFNCVYKIYTTQDDILKHSGHCQINALKEVIKVDFIPIDVNTHMSRYVLFSEMHRKITMNGSSDVAYIFDFPDHFYSNNLFGNLEKNILQSKRLIFIGGLRLNLQNLIEDPLYKNKIQNNPCFNNEDYLKLCLSNLHSHTTKKFFVENKRVLEIMSVSCWKNCPSSFFMLAFHFHPIYIWPEKKVTLTCQTVDQGEYLYRACPTRKYHSYCLSNDYIYFELTDKNLNEHAQNRKPKLISYLSWSKNQAHPIQRLNFGRRKFFSIGSPKFNLKKNIQWLSFVSMYHFLNCMPTILLKPFYYFNIEKKHRQPFISYLNRQFIANYYESILLGNCLTYPIETIVEFTNINFKYLRKRCILDIFYLIYEKSKRDAIYFYKTLHSHYLKNYLNYKLRKLALRRKDPELYLATQLHKI